MPTTGGRITPTRDTVSERIRIPVFGIVAQSYSTAPPQALDPLPPWLRGASTAKAAPSPIHHLRDGELVLFHRPRSRIWQCRYKDPTTGKWVSYTTGKRSLTAAAEAAGNLYDEARYRIKMGLAPTKRSFADIATATLTELRAELAAGTGKKIYVDYCAVIERYLIPFFGNKQLQGIKHPDVAAFEIWRNGKMGKAPKASTQMTFASAFARVHQTAIERGWISEHTPVPKLSRRGDKGEVRPGFSAQEVAQLRSFMRTWSTASKLDAARQLRALLCDYVELLLLTGMRHGTESMGIEWRHCEWHQADGQRYLRIWVSGKTGPRWLIAKHEAVAVLERLRQRQPDIAEKTLDAVLGRSKLALFRDAKCVKPHSFVGLFRRLMRDSGLISNAQGQTRTLYSLRHTYATAELLAGTDIHTLARQMGTSVLMLERHYSKLTATLAADKLAGQASV
jgi:integrase